MKILATLVLLLALPSLASVKTPKTEKELREVTVMVTNKSKNSGGSGVIYKSTSRASYVLTNAHVCEVLEEGGVVSTYNKEYQVEQYKKSKVHDICLVKIIDDLKVSTKLAKSSPEFGEEIKISGHPHLIPTTITKGHLSGSMEITLFAGVEKCDEKDIKDNGFLCWWFDGMPVIKDYATKTSSALIAPGNSGSAVFNSSGEIVGLAFAGNGRGLSHSFIVPLEYIKLFLKNHSKIKWEEANGSIKYSELRSKRNTSVNTKSNHTILIFTPENLQKLYFPAIKDAFMESLAEKLDSCKKGLGKCQNITN